jgi:hypothetical protein
LTQVIFLALFLKINNCIFQKLKSKSFKLICQFSESDLYSLNSDSSISSHGEGV